MNNKLAKILLLGGVFMQRPFEMFPTIMDPKVRPAPPKTLRDDFYISAGESARRNQAAIAKRERRANKLRKEHQQEV